MIVWLASYPRSGNTLLRTVLKQTMGMGSYSDEIMRPIVGLTDLAKEGFGDLTYESSWETFYHYASHSKEVFLIKTHLPPRDNQPAIYVVRDGRAATESYAAYHRSFAPDAEFCPSILELMLGDDYYGDWSSHYHMWNNRLEGSLVTVRFEELVNADALLVNKLKQFIGFKGEVRLFENSMEKLQKENPSFFRSGQSAWKSSPQWTEELESFFIASHGELLVELGYLDIQERDLTQSKLNPTVVKLIELAGRGFSKRNYWHHEAQSKEMVIQQLLAERQAIPVNNAPREQGWVARIFGADQSDRR